MLWWMAPRATKAASAVTSASTASVRYVGEKEVLLVLLAGPGPTAWADLAFSRLHSSPCRLTFKTQPLCPTVSGNGASTISTILSVTTTLPTLSPTASYCSSQHACLYGSSHASLGGCRQLPPLSLEGVGRLVLVVCWALSLQIALCFVTVLPISSACCSSMPRAPATFFTLILAFKATVLKV